MIKSALPLYMSLFFVLFSGCNGVPEEQNTIASPRLMPTAPKLLGTAPPVRKSLPPAVAHAEDLSVRLRRMELAHRERLAAIESERAKALRALELEKQHSIEEIRRRTAEIEAQNALRLEEEKRKYAALIAEKEKTITALETNASLHRDRTTEAIARMQTESRKEVAQITGKYEQAVALLKAKLQEKRLWITVGVILLLLLFWFLFYRYRNKLKMNTREEERRHEIEMLERRLRHEEIEKVLEIIASEKTHESVKIELARLLQRGTIDTGDPKLIIHRSDSDAETEASEKN